MQCVKVNNAWNETNEFYKKTNNLWEKISKTEFLDHITHNIFVYDSSSISMKLEIAAPRTLVAESCQCNVTANGIKLQSGYQLNVASGNTFATIDNTGLLTVLSSANNSNITLFATYNGFSATHSMNVTYKSGSISETTSEITTDESGNTIEITTTVTENEDGSSYVEETQVIVDESGNTIGTVESNIETNSDGSFSGSSTSYDSEGNPTETTNQNGDAEGNVSTQEIVYDESGNSVVTGYEIDTTSSPDGEKSFNADGVNTEFYGFDVTQGFIMKIHFIMDFAHQPSGQNENHHQVVTMKRATPEPWYGFQLRQTGTNKYVTLGVQFETGSNVNTQLTPHYLSGTTTISEYDLQIVYDPSAESNNFVCTDLLNNLIVYHADSLFPDLPELRYLTVCIGYGLDSAGTPYRYSNIDVLNFSITKLTNEVSDPEISCDGKFVTITCDTPNSTIHYKLNDDANYSTYASQIRISADTTVEAYAQKGSTTSNVVSALCIYDVIENPIIYCDGEEITLTCETPSVDIWYRLGQTGSFVLYDFPISISATTIIETYAQLDNKVSDTVIETCTYSPSTLVQPVIFCDGKTIEITCATPDASILYRLNQSGGYETYVSAITITSDTVVEAYSYLSGETSAVVAENCIYDPTHNYSLDYLTFRVLSGGTIGWKHYKNAKTIEYGINDGVWTTITSTTGGTMIQVSDGDVVRFRGNNTTYATDKSSYAGFEGGTAFYDVEGNVHSLLYGDNFVGNDDLTNSTYQFCSLFKLSNVVSAENLILPATTLKNYCYRAMFSKAYYLVKTPALPATTLSQGCYYYMFEACPFSEAPELNATTLVRECYYCMFIDCVNLSYIKCMATTSLGVTSGLTNWVKNVSPTGTFVKDGNTAWGTGYNGIPNGWVVCNDVLLFAPVISFDGDQEITIECETPGASIFYRLNETGNFENYSEPIIINTTTIVEAYSVLAPQTSTTVSETCVYVVETKFESSNKTISSWTYNNLTISTPYSVNRIDGHSSNYSKGTFNFETNINLRKTQPTYLWFQHADQSASIYVDNNLVEKHWGGYNAFFVDISNYAHKGTNRIKVALKNNEGNYLAPANGDFNFNATLGNVKLFTSPVLPNMSYGYDGFHVASEVANSSATINITTTVPSGASVICIIDDGSYYASGSQISDGTEMEFTDVIQNPHLWNGTLDPHLYTITLEIYYEGELYHRFQRPYGLRYYRYVINETISGNTYTGFLLNGSPYLLRGVCMHDDIDGKANALNNSDYTQEFTIIQELGCNFIRLAHYPHPKEVYDWCDQLGIIVQTEVPCVNKLQSTMPEDYYTHLEGQYTDMVNQHYNHPCIMFWGLSNETTTDDKDFGKTKIEYYTSIIKSLDSERLVGYVMSHSYANPSSYYNNPNVDWFGGNIYVGWYIDKASNDPTSQLNTRVTNIITNTHKALAFSEYGCGGTQRCHSEDPQTTTTKGNYERHDIEYQMWLHEGHIAAIRNFPQLLFTAEWQLFDIAVSNRNEGYTVCLDGETTSIDDSLRRLNDKGLVERDHVTKKDTFYIYKAEWSTQKFVHICGKDYTRKTDRIIKCYTNDGSSLSMYVNNTFVESAATADHITLFTSRNFDSGDVILVSGTTKSDTFTFE